MSASKVHSIVFVSINGFLFGNLQKLPTDLLAQLQVKCQLPVHSHAMLTQKIAVNTTSVWKVLPVNMVAQSEQYSKLVTVMVLATAKTQKMFPDGKFSLPKFYTKNTKIRSLRPRSPSHFRSFPYRFALHYRNALLLHSFTCYFLMIVCIRFLYARHRIPLIFIDSPD